MIAAASRARDREDHAANLPTDGKVVKRCGGGNDVRNEGPKRNEADRGHEGQRPELVALREVRTLARRLAR